MRSDLARRAAFVAPACRRRAILARAPSMLLAAGAIVVLTSLAAAALAPPGISIGIANAQQLLASLIAILALLAAAAAGPAHVRPVAGKLATTAITASTGLALWNMQPASQPAPSPVADLLLLVATLSLLWAVVPPVFFRGIERRQLVAVGLDAVILLVTCVTITGAAWNAILSPAGWTTASLASLTGALALIAGPAALFLGLLHRRAQPGFGGPYGVIDGLSLIGFAWIAWLALADRGEGAATGPTDFLYSIGVLLVAHGGATWVISPASSPRFMRFARLAVEAFPIVAVLVCVGLDVVSPESPGFDVVETGSAIVIFLALMRQVLLTLGERRARGSEVEALERLNREIRERASVLDALSRLDVGHTPEETARRVCEQALRVDGVDAAVLRTFEPDGGGVILAVAGPGDMATTAGMRLSRDRSTFLFERTVNGPWVEVLDPSRDPHIAHLHELGLRSTSNAPLLWNEQIIGVVGFSTTSADPSDLLPERLTTVRQFGMHAGALLGPALADRARRHALRRAVAALIDEHTFHPVFQPILDLGTGDAVGYEALTRFADGRRPDLWFGDAAACDMGLALETACLRAALWEATALPRGAWLSLNVSPELARALVPLVATLEGVDRDIVLEITEHAPVASYAALNCALGGLRPHVRIAIDDAGAGYAGLQHILEIEPDIVKLDITLTRSVDSDRTRRALVASMVGFARETGCTVLAEGIETEAELVALRELGVALGQGYLLARPAPIESLVLRAAS